MNAFVDSNEMEWSANEGLDKSTETRLYVTYSNRDKCTETMLPHDPIVLKSLRETSETFHLSIAYAQVQQYEARRHTAFGERMLVTADNVFICFLFFIFRLSLCVLITQSASINYQVCVISLLGERNTKQHSM